MMNDDCTRALSPKGHAFLCKDPLQPALVVSSDTFSKQRVLVQASSSWISSHAPHRLTLATQLFQRGPSADLDAMQKISQLMGPIFPLHAQFIGDMSCVYSSSAELLAKSHWCVPCNYVFSCLIIWMQNV